MPDTRDNGNLDTRIRELVARAVADAPAPPELDPSALPNVEPPEHGHRRWWVGGGAALLAAAAAIAAFVLVGDTDESVRTPPHITRPTVAPTTAPPTTGGSPRTLVPAAPILTAGPSGVYEHRGTEARRLTAAPTAIALDTGDGRVILQRQRGEGSWSEADTEPLVIDADASPEFATPLNPLFEGFDWGGYVMLHDVEVFGGRRLLLYSVFEGDPPRPQILYVLDLETGLPEQIGETDAADRLHLATTGLIVGEYRNQLTHGIEIHTVPGSPAAEAGAPTAAELGLDERGYFDCPECPTTFTVTPDGERIAWVERGDVVSVRLAAPTEERELIARAPDGVVVNALDVRGSIAAVRFYNPPTDPPQLMLFDGSQPVDLGEGSMITFGPLGSEPPPTVEPSLPLLTAGPDGVVEHRDGQTRTLTTEPMAIALDTGDGRVIAQRADESDTIPYVLNADGSLTPLFGRADWNGTVVLHDVEVVDGRRLLLYSLQVAMDNPVEANETLYVLDLETERATLVADGIGGWEFGTRRLHLARTGLIIGESYGEAIHNIEVQAVPDSPAAAAGLPTAADLGLDEVYDDCSDCPTAFTVTPDGQSIAWVDDGTLVVVALDPQDEGQVTTHFADGRVNELDLTESAALVSIFGDPPGPPLFVPLDIPSPVELEGTTATFGPVGEESSGTEPPSTELPSTESAPTTAPPATDNGLGVSFRDPPPMVEPAILATLNLVDDFTVDFVAVTENGGAVVVDSATGDAIIVDPDGATRTVPLEVSPFAVVAGPGDVLYGLSNAGLGKGSWR